MRSSNEKLRSSSRTCVWAWARCRARARSMHPPQAWITANQKYIRSIMFSYKNSSQLSTSLMIPNLPKDAHNYQKILHVFQFFREGPWHSSQTWTDFSKFGKTSSLRWVWGQLISPFISYGVKNEVDRGSFPWECSTRGTTEYPLWGFTVALARILRGPFSIHYYFH